MGYVRCSMTRHQQFDKSFILYIIYMSAIQFKLKGITDLGNHWNTHWSPGHNQIKETRDSPGYSYRFVHSSLDFENFVFLSISHMVSPIILGDQICLKYKSSKSISDLKSKLSVLVLQGLSWLENKITETMKNSWNHLHPLSKWSFLTVSSNFRKTISRGK